MNRVLLRSSRRPSAFGKASGAPKVGVMITALFYRCILERPLNPAARVLVKKLLARSQRIDALASSLPEQIMGNRERRTGNPVKLSRVERRTIASFERDSKQAAAELPAMICQIANESELLRTALATERTAR